jgi:prevent-host-death family protein
MWPDVAMKQVKIAELKNHLSRHLRAVEGGVEIEVTDRARPIARIIPVAQPTTIRIVPARRPFSTVRRKRYRPAGWSITSLELLMEDRRN